MFLANGFNDFASKPVNTNELVRILENWLPPKKIQAKAEPANPQAYLDKEQLQAVKTSESRNREIELKKELIVNFVEHNKNKYAEITEAIKAGDLVLANRMAHTLKSNAGQLGKTLLADACANIEHALADGKNNVTPKQLEIFETELKAVLLELMPQYEEIIDNANKMSLEPFDEESIRELLEKLNPLLESSNTLCFEFLDDLRRVPESAELIKQIKELNFSKAIDILGGMEKKLNIG
jgi:HPt (histidine-containing phosphotransfer) domain-containing protein